MKKFIYLLGLIAVAAIIINGCQKELLEEQFAPQVQNQDYNFKTVDAGCTVDLVAGQNITVGEITAEFNADRTVLTVQYSITNPDWCIVETHLDVQYEYSKKFPAYPNFPMTKSGNPKVGHFEFGGDYDCEPFVEEVIDLTLLEGYDSEMAVCIAAHAVVKNLQSTTSWCLDFETFEEYDQVSSFETEKGNLQFYMTDYSGLGSIGIGDVVDLAPIEGEYPYVASPNTTTGPPWPNIVGFTVGSNPYIDDFVAADPQGTGAGGNTLTDVPDFSQSILMQHAYSKFQAIVMDFTDFEYIAGIKFAGIDPDHNEIWKVVYVDATNTIIHIDNLGPYPSGQDGHAIPIGYDSDQIAKVVIWGSMNNGAPGVVGFAIDNICVEVFETETAWGDGEEFPGKQWAMYFCCLPPQCDEWVVYGTSLGGASVGGKIYKIDLATLTANELYNTSLNTGNGNWPNGNAFDAQNFRLYYSVKPNKLYFYDFAGNQFDATNGNTTPGDVACGSFYNGEYYYIPQNSNKLYKVTLNPADGKITSVVNIQTYSGKTFSFGDVVVSLDGMVLYGSSAVSGTGKFWSISLSDYSYTEINNLAHMQLAYGSDGSLYGHDAGNAHFYLIDEVAGTRSDLGVLTTGPSGGKFTDLASGPQCW